MINLINYIENILPSNRVMYIRTPLQNWGIEDSHKNNLGITTHVGLGERIGYIEGRNFDV